MAKVTMLTQAGAEAGVIELNDAIFAIEPNEFAVHAVIKNYLANQRQGTQCAKTRSDVRGGGRKPFRQKGTGRHRQGSSVDPTQVGGGVASLQSQEITAMQSQRSSEDSLFSLLSPLRLQTRKSSL